MPGLVAFARLFHALASLISDDWTTDRHPVTTADVKARFVEFAGYDGGHIHPQRFESRHLMGYWTF